MKAEKLLQQNPEAAKELHKWMFNKLTESFKDFDKDEAFKEYMLAKGVSDDQVHSIIDINPRACFDLLDSHEIIITIHYDKDYKTWHSNYHPDKDALSYSSRIDCEKHALSIGIVELENLLEDAKRNEDNTGKDEVSIETNKSGKD